MTADFYALGVAVAPRYMQHWRAYMVEDAQQSSHVVDCEPIKGVFVEGQPLFRIKPFDSRKLIRALESELERRL